MPSTIHILETALLILAAFLIGCVTGYLVRHLAARKPAQASAAIERAPVTSGPQLVVAPTIEPVARRPTPAQRLAAAAAGTGGRQVRDVAAPELTAEMQPAHVAGHATSGKEIAPPITPLPGTASGAAAVSADSRAAAPAKASRAPADASPVAQQTEDGAVSASPGEARAAAESVSTASVEDPLVASEPPEGPVRAEEVPQIDEAAHVVEGASRRGGSAPAAPEESFPEAPLAPSLVDEYREPAAGPDAASVSAPSAALRGDDAEAAAMRAIEGGWTPRAAVAPKQPAPQPDLTPGEIEAAMRSARSAVVSAAAAAEAAVAATASETEPAEAGPDRESGPLVFEPATREASPTSFLEGAPGPLQSGGMDFEPERPLGGFGRPEALAAPRAGEKDDLRRIKGITPELEQGLNRLGIFHYDQVAGWDQKAVVWLDHHLALRGRIGREKWMDQARALTGARRPPGHPIKH